MKIINLIKAICFIWLIIFVVDIFRMFGKIEPIIIFDEFEYMYEGNRYTEYTSLGYKVIITEAGWEKSGKVTFAFIKTAPDFDYIIREENMVCDKQRFDIYEDDNFIYYSKCTRNIQIEVDRILYSVEEAIKQNILTINQLIQELGLHTETKVLYTLETKSLSCPEYGIEPEFYTVINSGLAYYCLESVNIYVGPQYYDFKDAYLDKIYLESILALMTQTGSYSDGSKLYTDNYTKILVCNDGSIVLGNSKLESDEIFCK